MELSGKKAIVTAGGKGIGRAIALAYAKAGADVLISYRSDTETANATVEEIQDLGQRSRAIHADFQDCASIDHFFYEALDFLGSVDLLVNNAAGYNTQAFLDLDIMQFTDLLHVGIVTPMRLSQLTVRHMIEKKIRGHILNISSISGIKPYPKRSANSTAKGAFNTLTKHMALELAPYHIRVNAIAPGSTPYDSSDINNPSITKNIPLGRAGLPQDHAEGALFLASERAAWITGHVLVIDGGESL